MTSTSGSSSTTGRVSAPSGFIDQVLCTRYTDGGDSGSLVLQEGTDRLVGLHFAGASGGSVFSPIRPILRRVRGRLIRVPLNEA